MIGWRLTADFDKQHHLFSGNIKTDYEVEAYVCTCGHVGFALKHPTQKLKYKCQLCKHEKFYSANSAWRNIDHFLYQNSGVEMDYEYDILYDENHMVARYITHIPSDLDYGAQKVIFDKKVVFSLELNEEGELKESYLLKFQPEILKTLKKSLITHINTSNSLNLPLSNEKKMTLAMASFFLKNRHIKDFDFYYWADVTSLYGESINVENALKIVSHYRKEKSTKKAMYQNYVEQFSAHGQYDATFVELFTKHFSDANIVVKLLGLSLSKLLYSEMDKAGLDDMLLFLKKYYTQKQLLKFFSDEDVKSDYNMFKDMVNAYTYEQAVIEQTFRKVSCKVKTLHDEFVRCVNEVRFQHMYKKKLYYTPQESRACIKTSTYEVMLPQDGKELFTWAETLHNCMAGYFESIADKSTLVYCFFLEGRLSFAVELQGQQVVQAYGKYNTELTTRQKEALEMWYKRVSVGDTVSMKLPEFTREMGMGIAFQLI